MFVCYLLSVSSEMVLTVNVMSEIDMGCIFNLIRLAVRTDKILTLKKKKNSTDSLENHETN